VRGQHGESPAVGGDGLYDFIGCRGWGLAELMLDPRRGGRGGFRPFLAGIAGERGA
jgi:hypothetical protein